MFSKLVVLFLISAALAYHLQYTPEDLKRFFKDLDTQVKDLQHFTVLDIRDNVYQIRIDINDAKRNINSTITDAAKPFWVTVEEIQEAADEKGQDISRCIHIGNREMDALDATIRDSAQHYFDQYNQSAYDVLRSSQLEADSVLKDLIALEKDVDACSDDTCAAALKESLTQYAQRVNATLLDAKTKSENYCNEELPVLLANYKFDSELYASDYTNILDDIFICTNW